MNHPEVANLYKLVIEDVIRNIHDDFVNAGVDEQILFELQELWETKLIESRVLSNLEMHPGPMSAMGNTNVSGGGLLPGVGEFFPQHYHHHLSNDGLYGGVSSGGSLSGSGTGDGGYHPRISTAKTTSGAGSGGGSGGGGHIYYSQPYYTSSNAGTAANLATLANPHYADYRHASSSTTSPSVTSNTNAPDILSGYNTSVANLGRPRPFMPMQNVSQSNPDPYTGGGLSQQRPSAPPPPSNKGVSSSLPQYDGDTFTEKDMMRIIESSSKFSHVSQLDGSAGMNNSILQEDKDPASTNNPTTEDLLGSDLDDEDEVNDAFLDTDNVVLCQYEKANRTKSRWRCSLKDGLMHVKGIDYAFYRGTGEFDWM